MPRGKGCHSWRFVGFSDGKRGVTVHHFTCVHCAAQRASNCADKATGCHYRQQLIDWRPDPFTEQLRLLNQPSPEPPGALPPDPQTWTTLRSRDPRKRKNPGR